MNLIFNTNHIIYYHMDAQYAIGLEWPYFTSPDYLVVQCWVHSMLIQQGHMSVTIQGF